MRICVVDTETTGVNVDTCEIIELGYAIYDQGNETPIHMVSEYVAPKMPITEEIESITGIKQSTLDQFAEPPRVVLDKFLADLVSYDVSYLAGHNLKQYDMPVLKNNMDRCGVGLDNIDLIKIDTMVDLPLTYDPKSKKLSYMCADHGFLMPFQHRALFDALACGKLLFSYPFEKVLALASSPDVLLRAVVTYDDREKASKAGFRWNPERKLWLKTTKKCFLEKEVRGAGFTVVVL